MSTINNAMLKRCLIESTYKEIAEIEALDYSYVRVSNSFKEKVKEIISVKEEPKRKAYPKKIAIILIASVLLSLSIMFSVSANIRNAVSDFFVKVYETFSEIFVNAEYNEEAPVEYPKTIEQVYQPKYITNNSFVEIDKMQDSLGVFTVWSNESAIIDLSQALVTNKPTLDAEDVEYQTTYIGEKEIFYFLKNNIYTVVWIDYGYLFTMTCDECLGWAEIEKIIVSLEPIKTYQTDVK